MDPLRYVGTSGFGAVIFRRVRPQITQQGALWDKSLELYPHLRAEPRESRLDWTFQETNARISFEQMQFAKDALAWDGSELPYAGFDQLEQFEESQFWAVTSRLRSMSGVKPSVRGTCNPVTEDDPTGGWLHRLLAWWIDAETGYPIASRSGVIRWFVRVSDELKWADSPDELVARYPGQRPKSLTFIPSKLKDNPQLMAKDPDYLGWLMSLPYVERMRRLEGNWKVKAEAGAVFNLAWFEEFPRARRRVARRVRAWDKAGSKGKGDYSAGVLLSEADGIYDVEHIVRGQWSSHERNVVIKQTALLDGPDVEIWIEQEPGSGGKESGEISAKQLAGFRVHVRTVTGSKLARAGGFSAQCEAKNVRIVVDPTRPWVGSDANGYLARLHAFEGKPGDVDDEVDASSGAFNRLALGGVFDVLTDSATAPTQAQLEASAEAARDYAQREVDEAILSGGVYWPGGG